VIDTLVSAQTEVPVELLQSRIDAISPLAYAVCRALTDQVHKLGFPPGTVGVGDPSDAAYRLERDPASGESSLVGEWRDPKGQKLGNLVFHADGSFFVEYDVIRPHPGDKRWFVEAVNAWGRDSDIRAEPRLLPVVA
jgi:hypothetical protein